MRLALGKVIYLYVTLPCIPHVFAPSAINRSLLRREIFIGHFNPYSAGFFPSASQKFEHIFPRRQNVWYVTQCFPGRPLTQQFRMVRLGSLVKIADFFETGSPLMTCTDFIVELDWIIFLRAVCSSREFMLLN